MRMAGLIMSAGIGIGGATSIAVSCTFPDFDIHSAAAGGSVGPGSSSSAGLQGGAGQGAAGGGPATTGGQGGEGAGECGDGGFAGEGVGGDALCDKDGDTHYAAGQPCCGDDCDDEDAEVFWDQPSYFPVESKHNGWDYNCNKEVEKNTDQLFKTTGDPTTCTQVADCLAPFAQGYPKDVACGATEPYYKCQGVFGVNCSAMPAPAPEPLKCH